MCYFFLLAFKMFSLLLTFSNSIFVSLWVLLIIVGDLFGCVFSVNFGNFQPLFLEILFSSLFSLYVPVFHSFSTIFFSLHTV